MSPETALLQSMFPFSKLPFICSAPMRTVSGPDLAIAVFHAGGLGFYAAGYELANLSTNLSRIPALTPTHSLPLGLGFILFAASLPLALSSITTFAPTAIWLFAPRNAQELDTWITTIKPAALATKIFVQIGSISELERLLTGLAGDSVDVIVAQGVADSGGHGLKRGASVVSLVPECVELIRELQRTGRIGEGRVLPVLAAGGIMDGRGVAAALALGANGVVLGTRLVPTTESEAPEGFKNYLVSLRDGGQTTVRTRIFDQLRGSGYWPPQYNGRAAANSTFTDHERGLSEVENEELYRKAVGDEDWERLTMFMGTGVGLVKAVQPAGGVVEMVRAEAVKVLRETAREFCG